MSTKYSDLLATKQAEKAKKVIDYYDGKQDEYIISLLDDKQSGRKDWRSRGIVARYRNLVKMIINKSGLIANDKLPQVIVYDQAGEVENEAETILLNQLLVKADFEDLVKNNDPIIRSLSTTKVLVQYDSENDKPVFDILGLHNAATVLDEYHNLNLLIFKLSEDKDGNKRFRVFTKLEILDISVDKKGQEVITNVAPNVYNRIPIATFHDLNKPRCSDWNSVSTDLTQLNDIYNMHITDSEFALKHMKYGTWVTNCELSGTTSTGTTSEQTVYNRALPVTTASNTSQEIIIGPNSIVQLGGSKSDNPYFDWKSPVVDLKPLDEIVNTWVDSYATDWGVVIDESGSADSGFKLVVKELPNIEIKKARAKMQQAGYEELCTQVMDIYNLVYPGSFTAGSKPKVKFFDPILPVDETADEGVWSIRIQNGRATRVDYFMQKYDMTKEQAIEKITEIDETRSTQQVNTLMEMKNVPNAPTVQKFTLGN
jgi:hypothetical protein